LKADLAIATDEINNRQPQNVVKLVTETLSSGDKVGVFGIAYKPFTSVTEESQSLKIALLLAESGYKVIIFDPVVPKPNLRNTSIYESESPEELKDCKVIIVPRDFYSLVPLELVDLDTLLVI
jgi:UDP-glucose 6-dehydrogenase